MAVTFPTLGAVGAQRATLKERLVGIDAGRLIFALLVVLLHTLPTVQGDSAPATYIAMLCRAAVPFFFVASGYFLRQQHGVHWSMITRPLLRLAPIYAFWLLIYYALARFYGKPALLDLRSLLSGGTAFHLWFLPALGIATVVVSVGLATAGRRITGVLCLSLAVYALTRGAYHDVLALHGPAGRGGTLYAPLFVYLGAMMARHEWQPSLPVAAAVLLTGMAGQILEEAWLSQQLLQPLTSHDFTITTYLYGLGAFMLARALPSRKIVLQLARLGSLSLGIYLAHVMFLWMLQPVTGNATLGQTLRLMLLCALGAIITTTLLRALPGLRRTVA